MFRQIFTSTANRATGVVILGSHLCKTRKKQVLVQSHVVPTRHIYGFGELRLKFYSEFPLGKEALFPAVNPTRHSQLV